MKTARVVRILSPTIALAGLLALPATSTQAAERSWTGGTASYTNAANWTGGVVPGPADTAINANGTGNAVQINAGDPDWSLGKLRAGSGAFTQSGQTLSVTNYFRSVLLGDAPGTTGLYTLSGGTIDYGGEFVVGQLGQAAMNISGGSIVGSGNFAVNIGSSMDTVSSTYGGTNKSDYTWFEQGFYTADPTRGIPPAGSTFTSETLPDHSYTMPANYGANNAVQVFDGVTTATITFTTPTAASALSLLGSAGFGTANLNYTVHHADSTTETGTLAVLDWFDNGGTVAQRAGGRISANGMSVQIVTDGPNFPYLLSFDIAVTNTSSPITSVDLTHTSGGVANIFAVSSSTGGNFTPKAITGFNQDVIVELGAPMYVAGTVTDVLTQTAGTVDLGGEFWVGNYGAGVYNFNGGTNNFRNWTALGRSGGHGTMNMTGGVINKIGNGNFIMGTAYQNPSGGSPSGVLNQSGGIINCSGEFMIPENSPAAGEYHLSGTGELNVTNWMEVGRSGGSGTMTMTGGTVRKSGGGVFIVADNATGSMTQSGGSIFANEIWVGNGGSANGTYDFSGTASLSVDGYVVIGRDGMGQFNMSGGTFTKPGSGGHFIIASGGFGTLAQSGGSVVSTASDTWVAENGTATWTLSGSASATLSKVVLGLNGAGSGTLNLYGGSMTVNELAGGGGLATLNFGGGTLVAGASGNFIHDVDTANIEAAGAFIDTAGQSVIVASPLLEAGGGALTKNGPGTLTLSAANTYAGATIVNAGELVTTTASTGAGSFAVANGAGLGVQVATDNGQLPASSVALTGTASTLDVDLSTFGSPAAAPLAITGELNVNGTVTVNILASAALQVGVYPLITCGSRTGAGSFSLGTLPLNTVATLVDNGTTVSLNITDVNAPRWEGLAGGNWDIGLTTNWINGGSGLPTYFSEGSEVLFNDEALGTTTVNLVATVHPTTVTVNNTNLPYTLAGTGKISGTTGLSKQGTGTLTIATVNDYTGPTVISAGVVSVTNLANTGSASAIGKGNLVLGGGTLSYAGPAVAINRGYNVQANSSIDAQGDLALSGVATAAANSGLTKTGPAQLTYTTVGSNYLSAGGSPGYLVRDGSVRFDGSAGPQTNIVQGGRLGIGEVGGLASVVISNSVMDASDIYLGDADNTVGSLTADNGANVTSRSWLILGNSPNSVNTMTVNTGATVNVPNGRLFLCAAPGTTATLNINGGVINKSSGDIICIADGGWNGPGARTGIVNQVGGAVTIAPEVQLGQWADSTGIWNLHGGTIDSTGWFVIGRAGGNGTFNMDGGTLTHTSGGTPAFIVGSGAGNNSLASIGVLNQSAGTLNCNSEYWVGENALSVGTNNISGTAVVNIGNWMSIGRGGLGVVNFLGGTMTKTGGGNFIIGDNGTGIFVQSGGTLSINNEFWIGQSGSGNGTFNLSAGTVTVGSWVAVGRAGATGLWNMSGGSFTKTGNNGNHFIVGSGGPATLNQTGGTITSVLSDTWVAENSDGTWNLNGGNAELAVLHIAQNSGRVGVFNLNTTGTLTATEVTTGNAGSTSTLNINGGTLVAGTGANANFLHGLTSANILSGGATIDSSTNVINVSQPLLDGGGAGGLTKLGAGTLRLNGANTYTGSTLVNAGTLGGTGTIVGPVFVAAAGTLAPGASVGTLTVNNNVTLGGTLAMEVSKDGGVPSSDLLAVSGNLTFGGTLTVTLTGTNALAINDTFNLMDWTTRSGSFTTINLPAGYAWDVTQLSVDGTIRVTAIVPPALNPPVVVGGSLVVTGVGGPAGASYTWLSSTNVAAPVASWTTNTTGVFDASGGFSNALPINVSEPRRFFQLRTP